MLSIKIGRFRNMEQKNEVFDYMASVKMLRNNSTTKMYIMYVTFINSFSTQLKIKKK